MLGLSIFVMLGCEAHLGVLPATGAWSLGDVRAPVAEPDADRWARDALVAALSAREALAASGPAVDVLVTQASFTPARRSTETLLYDATVTLTLTTANRTVTRSITRSVVDPGNASGAASARADILRGLVREAVDQAVAGLLSAP